MVDVIGRTDAVCKTKKIVDRSKNIFLGNVLGSKLGESLTNELLDISLLSLALKSFGLGVGNDLLKNTESYLLACLYAAIGKVVAEYKLGTNGIVAEYLNLALGLGLNGNLIYEAILDRIGELTGDLCACLGNDLTGKRINNGLGKGLTLDSSCKSNLAVVLITTNSSKVVSLGIEEHIVDKDLGGLNVGRLAGTELLVDLLKSFLTV